MLAYQHGHGPTLARVILRARRLVPCSQRLAECCRRLERRPKALVMLAR